jgi:hypothetical protein
VHEDDEVEAHHLNRPSHHSPSDLNRPSHH